MIPLILPILRKYWKLAVGAIILLWAYYLGYSHEKARYDAFVKEIEASTAVVKAENDRKVSESKEITNNVTKEYANAVQNLNAYYASHPNIKWMHDNQACGQVSSVPISASKIDGVTKGDSISTDGVTPLMCADDVLQLLMLQKWVKDQEGIK